MNHTGTLKLETERMILRPMSVEDAPVMYKNWAADPAVTEFLTWNPHADIDETRFILASWAERYADPAYYHWGMELKGLGELIGALGAVNMHENHSSCEMGYCMGKAWWGKGLMTEALTAVVAHMFERVEMNRVEAYHDVLNPASGRVMLKSGMRHEGVKRQARFHHRRGFFDLSIYGILRSDYYGA